MKSVWIVCLLATLLSASAAAAHVADADLSTMKPLPVDELNVLSEDFVDMEIPELSADAEEEEEEADAADLEEGAVAEVAEVEVAKRARKRHRHASHLNAVTVVLDGLRQKILKERKVIIDNVATRLRNLKRASAKYELAVKSGKTLMRSSAKELEMLLIIMRMIEKMSTGKAQTKMVRYKSAFDYTPVRFGKGKASRTGVKSGGSTKKYSWHNLVKKANKDGKKKTHKSLHRKATKLTGRDFRYKGFEMIRVRFQGQALSSNLRKACEDRGMEVLIDNASYMDGRGALVSTNWHFSHPSHQRSHGLPVGSMRNTFFYCGNSNNQRSLYAYSNTHRWSDGNDRNGFTYCARRTESPDFSYNGFNLKRVHVRAHPSSGAIEAACKKFDLRPVCDYPSYLDGVCIPVQGSRSFHLSHSSHISSYGIPMGKVLGAYFYSGHSNNQRSLLARGYSGHRWSNNNDQGGDTFCTSRDRSKDNFKWNGYNFYRVRVRGVMNSRNMARTCAKLHMRPACARRGWADGVCKMTMKDGYSMDVPSQAASRGVSRRKVSNTFWYAGRANNGRSRRNYGYSDGWSDSNGGDRDGDMFCVVDTTSRDLTYKKFRMVRTTVKGPMKSKNILAACSKLGKDWKPVCDHSSYNDGKCIQVGGQWHFSHPSNVRARGIDQSKLRGAFFYCGYSNNYRSLLNHGNSHRWSEDNRDKDGDTYCTRMNYRRYRWTYGGFRMARVPVQGAMFSSNIRKACSKLGKNWRPSLDHAHYGDGQSYATGQNWHWSISSNVKNNGGHEWWVNGAFMYAGSNHQQRSLKNRNDGSHAWSDNRDKDGDTICAKPLKPGNRDFIFRGLRIFRTRFQGTATSGNLWRACKAKGARPIIDHPSYARAPGLAIQHSSWHWSHSSQVRNKGVAYKKLVDAYWWCGTSNSRWALQGNGNSHRWSNSRDRDGETYCAVVPYKKWSFSWKGYRFTRVPVKGIMRGNNLVKACKVIGEKPVCDHSSYRTSQCIHPSTFGNGWHFSHPSNAKNHGIDQNKITGAFFYHNGRTLMNTGTTHRWNDDNDHDGDTYCVRKL